MKSEIQKWWDSLSTKERQEIAATVKTSKNKGVNYRNIGRVIMSPDEKSPSREYCIALAKAIAKSSYKENSQSLICWNIMFPNLLLP